jgi:hypothetical protein
MSYQYAVKCSASTPATCISIVKSVISMAKFVRFILVVFNPLNAELNPTCHFLALLGAHHILHVSRIRVNLLFLSKLVRGEMF